MGREEPQQCAASPSRVLRCAASALTVGNVEQAPHVWVRCPPLARAPGAGSAVDAVRASSRENACKVDTGDAGRWWARRLFIACNCKP